MRSVGFAVVGFCALCAICVGVADATVGGGGATITSAPVVPSGVTRDSSTGTYTDTCGNTYEFWMLQLTQGDLVKITWGSPAAVDTLALWPAGTSDSSNPDRCFYDPAWSHWSVSPVLTDSNTTPTTTHVAQTVVTADGNYPLLFLDTTGAGNAGDYSFTAVVLHAATVSFAHQSRVPGTGTFTASVLAPDSSPITASTLKLRLKGYWRNTAHGAVKAHTLATATPTAGSVTFDYSLPPAVWGKKIQLGISGGGSDYQSVASQRESVKVQIPASVLALTSPTELKTASRLLRQPIYWAGLRKGMRYEFTRTTNGYVYVRYLPHAVHAGDPRPKFLIVATYPLHGAYNELKKAAKGKVVAGPNGSIYFPLPGRRTSVYVAFPHVNYEIEIYDPSPKVARAIAANGQVRPVR